MTKSIKWAVIGICIGIFAGSALAQSGNLSLQGSPGSKASVFVTKDISDPYGTCALPTKILIDPDGMIIGRYDGNCENAAAMDRKLKEVFE